MEKEGVELISRISSVIGFTEAVRHLGTLIKSYNAAKDALIKKRPDVLVLIDYPDFNIALAGKAKAAGIPVLYYVSPQVWAWRAGRVKKIAALVDKIAVLFPFEVDYYKNAGLPCEFVGHPVAEIAAGAGNRTRQELKQELGLDPERPVISLLPGSRPAEIQRHMPVIREVAARIHSELPGFQTVVPLARTTECGEDLKHVTVFIDRTREALACSDAAAVASGTATLETALAGTPMVVFYKASFFSFHLARAMVKVRFVSLVNLLSGREVVRELLQEEAAPERIFAELRRILTDRPYRDAMVSGLKKIQEMMQGKRPSVRVAEIAGELAGW
ncbi:MAG: lipid-A-disaccharide synthase [Deferribacteres bacterium]|nr:lipid-A-disaccharide synthase [Deferribacteres bacterium]